MTKEIKKIIKTKLLPTLLCSSRPSGPPCFCDSSFSQPFQHFGYFFSNFFIGFYEGNFTGIFSSKLILKHLCNASKHFSARSAVAYVASNIRNILFQVHKVLVTIDTTLSFRILRKQELFHLLFSFLLKKNDYYVLSLCIMSCTRMNLAVKRIFNAPNHVASHYCLILQCCFAEKEDFWHEQINLG